MLLVHVLHHRHLELPRQADDRRHGEQREGDPAQVAAAGVDDEEPGDRLLRSRPVEQLAEAVVDPEGDEQADRQRSEEHTSELQSLMRISYAVFCLKKKTNIIHMK